MSLAAGVACEFSLALLLNLAIFAAIGESPARGIFTCVLQTCLQPLHLWKPITGLASYSISAALHVLCAGNDAHIGKGCCHRFRIGLRELFHIAGSQQKVVGALLPLVATVILVVAGAGLTGPSMNPAHAFSWNYFLQVL